MKCKDYSAKQNILCTTRQSFVAALVILTLAIVFCRTGTHRINNLTSGIDITIVFSDRITILGQHSDEFGGTTFKPITILFDNKIVFHDSLNEYWLTNHTSNQYLKLIQCSDGNDQILIEVDERPNQNELIHLIISKDGKLVQDRLPIFNWIPTDIDNDRKLELSGILTNGETIADGDTAFYNPTMVYELTKMGLSLDSTATIEINRKIWGQFYGFKYNDSLLLYFDRKEL
jgi:hypothetical protein